MTTILLVDDERLVLRSLEKTLRIIIIQLGVVFFVGWELFSLSNNTSPFLKEVIICTFVGGCASIILTIGFFVLDRRYKQDSINTLSKVSYLTALLIGFIQCLAMVPGTSRSAVTIIGAMLLGSSRVVAAEFSFFLAIPTMVAASGYSLLKYGGLMNLHQFAVLAVGFIVSFFVAWGVIAGFMKFIQRHNFIPFGIYRIILGAAVLGYFFLVK